MNRREKLVRKTEADIQRYVGTPEYLAEVARLKQMPDSEIDYSDIAEMSDEDLVQMVRAVDRKAIEKLVEELRAIGDDDAGRRKLIYSKLDKLIFGIE